LKSVHRGREEFGARLRTLRENARLTGAELAARLGWQGSKVSKIEHGKQTPSVDDVTVWVQEVAGSDELLAELLADLRAVRVEYRTWARLLKRGTAVRQRAVAPLDAVTTLLRAFEPAVVPGLLQTAEYARHVLHSVVELRGLPDDVTEGVRARMERQATLYHEGKQFRFLVTEAALQFRVCPTVVLQGQLDRLLAVGTLPNIELAVIPTSAQLPFPAMHGFWIYDDKLVLVDTVSAELALRDQDDIELYERLFERLWEVAAHGHDARQLITKSLAAAQPAPPGRPG
jgi:transcriptional regulator with XRE-family HTH domain